MYKERYKHTCDHVVSLHRATASYQSQAEHSGHEVRKQVAINQKTNKYIPSEQFGHLKSQSAVAERGMGYKHQVADLESTDLDVAYDDTIQKMPSHSRMKKAPSPDTYSSKVQQNSPDQHGITYRVEGNSLKSWKPIHGHKITGSFKWRHEMSTSKPLNSEDDVLTYEVNAQDAEEEEESDHNITVHNEDGEDGDEEYDDIKNDYARKIQETRKSDGSNIGLQSIYQHKDDGVQRIRNQVPYSARIKDGARSYTRGSISRSSENGADDNERTENIIQSRIERLKDSIKREMTREF
jgi:hypothetical protein